MAEKDKKELIEQGRQALQEEGGAGSAVDLTTPGKDPDRNPLQQIKGKGAKDKQRFLRALIDVGGSLVAAAEQTGIPRYKHYDLWLKDPDYKAAYEYARTAAKETLEAEAVRRAALGFEEPVFYQGKRVDTVRKYSDNLLMFLLKKLDPSYRDNQQGQQIGIWGSDGSNIAIQFNIPRPDQWEQKAGKPDN